MQPYLVDILITNYGVHMLQKKGCVAIVLMYVLATHINNTIIFSDHGKQASKLSISHHAISDNDIRQ